jgi:putative heme-binding domain-containing protein
MALLTTAGTLEEQIHYLLCLRNVKQNWTIEDRKAYFGWFQRDRSLDKHPVETVKWFAEAGRAYGDGASFKNFMDHIRKDALVSLTESERTQIAALLDAPKIVLKVPTDRKFVKEWKVSELLPSLESVGAGRSFERGKKAFEDAQCLACHRFGNEGGAAGPDLTAVSSRFTRRDVLESIIEPSKIISDQYQNILVTKRNGDEVTGRVVEESAQTLVLLLNPLTNEKVEVRKRDVRSREPSKISPMPEGLVNICSKEDILDLLAYIEAGGQQAHAAFKK